MDATESGPNASQVLLADEWDEKVITFSGSSVALSHQELRRKVRGPRPVADGPTVVHHAASEIPVSRTDFRIRLLLVDDAIDDVVDDRGHVLHIVHSQGQMIPGTQIKMSAPSSQRLPIFFTLSPQLTRTTT
jgi:hypothetical protein